MSRIKELQAIIAPIGVIDRARNFKIGSRRNFFRLVALLGLGGVLMVACGGEDDDETNYPPPQENPPGEEATQSPDEIRAELNGQVEAIFDEFLQRNEFLQQGEPVEFHGGRVIFYVRGPAVNTDAYLKLLRQTYAVILRENPDLGLDPLENNPLIGTFRIALSTELNTCTPLTQEVQRSLAQTFIIETDDMHLCDTNAFSTRPVAATPDGQLIQADTSLIVATSIPPGEPLYAPDVILTPKDGSATSYVLTAETVVEAGTAHEWVHQILRSAFGPRSEGPLNELSEIEGGLDEEEVFAASVEGIMIRDYLGGQRLRN